MSSRTISFFLIGCLWCLCGISAWLVLQQPSAEEPGQLRQSEISSSFNPDFSGASSDFSPPISAREMVFPSQMAFMEYFRFQFSEAELTASLKQAGIQGRNDSIEVKPRRNGKGRSFDDRYHLKPRFAVKPVPQS